MGVILLATGTVVFTIVGIKVLSAIMQAIVYPFIAYDLAHPNQNQKPFWIGYIIFLLSMLVIGIIHRIIYG
jgi:hypothetical protein